MCSTTTVLRDKPLNNWTLTFKRKQSACCSRRGPLAVGVRGPTPPFRAGGRGARPSSPLPRTGEAGRPQASSHSASHPPGRVHAAHWAH